MAAGNTVLLARPHPFIAEHMKKFLTENGYTPTPLHDLVELKNYKAEGIKGAVISTSVVSDIEGTYIDVLKAIRDEYPNVPVMLATLGKPADMMGSISRSLREISADAELLEVATNNISAPGLGTTSTYVLIHKNCLTSPEGIVLATKMTQSHFGLSDA